ncbi:MAG: DUF4173 domain-containing protein [Steroidobacteraceae bacterium]
MTNQQSPPPNVAAWKLWLVALILAVCETWINFGATPGLNWFLSALATSQCYLLFRWAAGKPTAWRRILALIFGCLLAGGAAITASPHFAWLGLVGAVGALAIGLRADTNRAETQHLGARDLLLASATTGHTVLSEAGLRIGAARRSASSERGVPVLRGIALATPLTVGLALLLSNADPLLAYWRDSLAQALVEISFLTRTLCFAAFGALSLGVLGGALNAYPPDVAAGSEEAERRFSLGPTERLIVLGSVVALFGLFFILQISHFFGNAAAVPGSGITYAQAAHEGFGELTMAASLCVALLIALAASSAAGTRGRAERTLSAALVLEAQILLVSAYYRIGLYENVYGFTELRLYVQCYAGVVFVGLGQLGLEVIGRPDFRRLARHWAVTVMLAMTVLIYWNHAAWIARANFERYETRDSLDLRYLLVSLGPDAVPEIIRFLPRLPPNLQTDVRACLRVIYSAEASRASLRPWYEWSYRRAQLTTALRTRTASLPIDITDTQPAPPLPCAWQ